MTGFVSIESGCMLSGRRTAGGRCSKEVGGDGCACAMLLFD